MIPVPAYIARAIRAWNVWRVRERFYRAMPELRAIDREERARKRKHKPVRDLRQQRSKLLHAELAREVRS
jgi:hypothetical protein